MFVYNATYAYAYVECMQTNTFSFRSKHVPGVKYEISDSLSRLHLDRFKTLAPMADEVPYRCPSVSRVTWH